MATELERIVVSIHGDNKKYIGVLKNTLKETKNYVNRINRELARIQDPGAKLGKGKRRGKGGKGAAALGFIDAGAALDLGGGGGGSLGLLGDIGSGAGRAREFATAINEAVTAMGGWQKAMQLASKAGLPGLVIAVGIAGAALAHHFNPWIKQTKKELEDLQKTVEGLRPHLDRTFNEQLKSIQFSDGLDDEIERLKLLENSATNGLGRAESEVIQFKNRMDEIEGGWFSSWFDDKEFEQLKVMLKDAEDRTTQFSEQLGVLRDRINEAEYRKKIEDARPGPQAGYLQGLDNRLVSEEIGVMGRQQGLSDLEISLQKEFVSLQREAEAAGRPLTEQQTERIKKYHQELMLMDERNRKLDEEAKLEAERIKATEQAEKELQRVKQQEALDFQRKQEQLANRAFQLLQGQRTEAQRLNDDLAEIDRLMNLGALTRGQGQGLKDALTNDLVQQLQAQAGVSRNTAGGAIVKGSREAYSATRFGTHNRRTEEDIRKQLKENVKQTVTLQQIRDQMKGAALFGPPVASIPGA